jgi:hypothetical protein
MNTELVTLQKELTIAKQQNEINELRYKLQITQAEKSSKLEDSLFSPALYEHYQKVAMMMSKSEIVPNSYRGKPADIFIAMEMGYQLGFPIAQSLQDIAVINGRPCLWGDGLLALVLSHPDCEGVNEEPLVSNNGDVVGYKCTVKRKGFEPREQIFTLKDAQAAGLLKKVGPWTQYPKRMLQMRARAFALRDVFGDALRGFKVAEEQQDAAIIDVEIAPSSPTGPTQTDKLKTILGIGETVNANGVAGSIGDVDIIEPAIIEPGNVSSSQDDSETSAESRAASSDNNVRISAEQLARIDELFNEKKFTQERREKAFAYYKVNEADMLSCSEADEFIKQLEKSK